MEEEDVTKPAKTDINPTNDDTVMERTENTNDDAGEPTAA